VMFTWGCRRRHAGGVRSPHSGESRTRRGRDHHAERWTVRDEGMAFNLHGRSFLMELDFSPDELRFLLKLSADLKGINSL